LLCHFDAIHRVTTTPAAIERIASEVVTDFAAQRCVYLELRTTPKATREMSKEAYVRAVLRGIDSALRRCPEIDVGILLSINRATDNADAALECVELARRFRDAGDCVFGVELSGNPTKGDVSQFADAIRRAHELQLGCVDSYWRGRRTDTTRCLR
jgi:adenosine deaminase